MTRLQTGATAPIFAANDYTGSKIRLSDFAQSYVLLAFLRYSECPWCNLALHRLTMENNLLEESDCKVIAFIQSPPNEIRSSINEKHHSVPKFPVIPDSSMKIYGKYGAELSALSGLRHHVRHLPSWVQSVYTEKFTQKSINGEFFLAPAAILISPGDQKIIRADYKADFYEHEPFTHIYDAIAEHQLYGIT